MKKFLTLLALFSLYIGSAAFAQESCASLLTDDYVSNGQHYATKINFDETKECEITFIEGNEYRLIACSKEAQKVQMQIIDKQNNVLFDNKKFDYTNYWNFKIKKTINCTVRLTLVDNDVKTDEIILLVGFKK